MKLYLLSFLSIPKMGMLESLELGLEKRKWEADGHLIQNILFLFPTPTAITFKKNTDCKEV